MFGEDTLTLTPKQVEFVTAVFSGQYKYLMYGGAIRGGKTVCLLAVIFILCRIFPGSRWAIVRKDLPTLRRNTVPSFDKMAPRPFCAELNQGTWSVRCANGSEILFFSESIATDPDLNRWKGLEVNGFALEEANELQEVSWFKALERAGSWVIPGKGVPQPPPLILLTCNPAQNWVKERFYDPYQRGTLEAPFYYCQATIDDNDHIPQAYKDSLKNLPEPEYRRFVLGDWGVADDPTQLIKYEWVRAAQQREGEGGIHKLGVDVARYGADDTTLCEVRGSRVHQLDAYHGKSIEDTVQIVANRLGMSPINADQCQVDSVGLGAGVVDGLARLGYHVHEFIGGGRAIDVPESAYSFANRRSQGWWNLRELLRAGDDVSSPLTLPGEIPPKLLQDLTTPRYEMHGDRTIVIESKDDIKRRIGRSTDYGDALMQAVAPLPPGVTWGTGSFRG